MYINERHDGFFTLLLHVCYTRYKDKVKILFKKNFFYIKNDILYGMYNINENDIPCEIYGIDENDIPYKMYKINDLNSYRLEFIIENYFAYLNISSSLIKKFMRDNNKKILEILFKKHLKFFDNFCIIKLLNYYKNKTPISDFDLNKLIDNDKYKISTEFNKDFSKYNSSFYLFNACKSGNKRAVKFLLEHDADINKENIDGWTPLFSACSEGHIDVVKYLVEHGANINNEDDNGNTPLFYASKKNHEETVKYLVEHGANINKENVDGWTPLFSACYEGHIDVVKYLVEHGANINKKDESGWTPLIIACQVGHTVIVKYLVEHGANINNENDNDNTPFFYALKKNHEDIVKYLVEHGANIKKYH